MWLYTLATKCIFLYLSMSLFRFFVNCSAWPSLPTQLKSWPNLNTKIGLHTHPTPPQVYNRLGIWHLDLAQKIKTSPSWTLMLSFSLFLLIPRDDENCIANLGTLLKVSVSFEHFCRVGWRGYNLHNSFSYLKFMCFAEE